VRVNADIAHGAGDVTVLLQRNVRTVHHVLLGQTEVDHVDRLILPQLPPTDDEILRLHVAVDQISRMNVLQSTQLRTARSHVGTRSFSITRSSAIALHGDCATQKLPQIAEIHVIWLTRWLQHCHWAINYDNLN